MTVASNAGNKRVVVICVWIHTPIMYCIHSINFQIVTRISFYVSASRTRT